MSAAACSAPKQQRSFSPCAWLGLARLGAIMSGSVRRPTTRLWRFCRILQVDRGTRLGELQLSPFVEAVVRVAHELYFVPSGNLSDCLSRFLLQDVSSRSGTFEDDGFHVYNIAPIYKSRLLDALRAVFDQNQRHERLNVAEAFKLLSLAKLIGPKLSHAQALSAFIQASKSHLLDDWREFDWSMSFLEWLEMLARVAAYSNGKEIAIVTVPPEPAYQPWYRGLPPYVGFEITRQSVEGIGVRVMAVHAKSPASMSGLVVGDVLLAIDQLPMHSSKDFKRQIKLKMPTDVLTIDLVSSDGSRRQASVELAVDPKVSAARVAELKQLEHDAELRHQDWQRLKERSVPLTSPQFEHFLNHATLAWTFL